MRSLALILTSLVLSSSTPRHNPTLVWRIGEGIRVYGACTHAKNGLDAYTCANGSGILYASDLDELCILNPEGVDIIVEKDGKRFNVSATQTPFFLGRTYIYPPYTGESLGYCLTPRIPVKQDPRGLIAYASHTGEQWE